MVADPRLAHLPLVLFVEPDCPAEFVIREPG